MKNSGLPLFCPAAAESGIAKRAGIIRRRFRPGSARRDGLLSKCYIHFSRFIYKNMSFIIQITMNRNLWTKEMPLGTLRLQNGGRRLLAGADTDSASHGMCAGRSGRPKF